MTDGWPDDSPPDPQHLEALDYAFEMLEAGTYDAARLRERYPDHADAVEREVAVLHRLDDLPLVDDDTVSESSANGGPWTPERVGEFRIRHEIGRGGMGVVYAAQQPGLDRTIALKILPASFAAAPQLRQRFEREAALAARLSHPAIVRVFAVGEDAGVHYIAMEFIDGPSMHEVLARLTERTDEAFCRTLDASLGLDGAGGHRAFVDRIVDAGIVIADALEAAHVAGLMHRDVKPANILFARDGRVYLADFGLAREQGSAGLTASGQVLGTPEYLAPECVEGSPADARADTYSLGTTLYEALCGRGPFRAETTSATLQRVLHYDPPSLDRADRRIPADLANIIACAMEKEPDRRYASSGQFRDDLRRFRRGETVTASRVGRVGRMLRKARRRPWQTALSLVTILAISAVIVAVASGLERRARDRTSARTRFEVGEAHQRRGEYRAAALAFDEALRLDPRLEAAADAARRVRARIADRELQAEFERLLSRTYARFLLRYDDAPKLSRAIAEIGDDALAPSDVAFLRALDAHLRDDLDAVRAIRTGLPPDSTVGAWIDASLCRARSDAAGMLRALRRVRRGPRKTRAQFLCAAESYCLPHLDLTSAEAVLQQAARQFAKLGAIPFRRGMLRKNAGRVATALDGLGAGLELMPEYPEARVFRARVYRERGQLDDALRDADIVLAKEPTDSFAVHEKALTLFWMRRREEASDLVGRALAAAPDDARLLHARGRLRQFQSRFEPALEDLRRAATLEPAYTVDLVSLLCMMRRRDEADGVIRQVLSSRCKLSSADAARLFVTRGDLEPDDKKSLEYFRRAVELVRMPAALSGLAHVLLNRHYYAEAGALASELLGMGFLRSRGLALRGASAFMQLELAQAIRDLDGAIAKLPDDRFADQSHYPYFFRAMAAHAAGDEAAADEWMEKAMKRSRDPLLIRTRLAWMMDWADEDAILETARGRLHGRFRVLLRGYVAARRGDYGRARDALRGVRAGLGTPVGLASWPSTMFWLGVELAASAGTDSARGRVGEMLVRGDADAAAVAALVPRARTPEEAGYLRWAVGRIHLQASDADKALPWLEAAAKAVDDSSVRRDCGVALAAAGRTESAFEQWRVIQPGSAGMFRLVVGLIRAGVRDSAVRRWLGHSLER